MSFGWHLPLLACPLLEHVLRRSPADFFSPPPAPPCRNVVRVHKDPLLPLPNWSKGRRSSSSCTCDRLRKRCLLQRSSSRSWDRQVNVYITHENCSRWTLSVFEGESFPNRYKLSPRYYLVSFVAICRKFFVFHVAIPSIIPTWEVEGGCPPHWPI